MEKSIRETQEKRTYMDMESLRKGRGERRQVGEGRGPVSP